MSEFVTTYTDLHAFADVALPFLLQDEALNNLQLGATQRMLEDPTLQPAFLATIHSESGAVEATATLNPGLNLILSGGSAAGVARLCDSLINERFSLPGVVGPTQAAETFADIWCTRRGLQALPSMRKGIFVLRTLHAPPLPPGEAVAASLEHLPLLFDWTRQFCDELRLLAPPPSLERLKRRIEAENAFAWLMPSGEPAAMAMIVRESPAGAVVSIVYTPPKLRGNGFAAACVAYACDTALRRGKRFCALYADRNNMTSTGIYRRIGFHQIATSEDISFVAPTAPASGP